MSQLKTSGMRYSLSIGANPWSWTQLTDSCCLMCNQDGAWCRPHLHGHIALYIFRVNWELFLKCCVSIWCYGRVWVNPTSPAPAGQAIELYEYSWDLSPLWVGLYSVPHDEFDIEYHVNASSVSCLDDLCKPYSVSFTSHDPTTPTILSLCHLLPHYQHFHWWQLSLTWGLSRVMTFGLHSNL